MEHLLVALLLINVCNADEILLGYLAGVITSSQSMIVKQFFPGNKPREGTFEYDAPGLRISGALSLAVDEANNGKLCCGHK